MTGPATSFHDLTLAEKNEFWAVLALRHAEGIGPRRAARLVGAYGSALAAVEDGMASSLAWSARKLVPGAVARGFAAQTWRVAAGKEWEAAQKGGFSFLLHNSEAFPEGLREVPDAPLLLYYKGDAGLLHGPSVAVVGARDCTREGIAVSAYFARDLSRAGVTVVSGMARGIDRSAHLGGLEGPGRSIAVLGTGIDVAYPSCNADLYALLANEGLILSEFGPGTGAAAANFPVRNRLISGLSQGILVVEAAGRSGSLITARLALEQNREVFAVPGHTMAAVSEGCRELVRQGAKVVFSADDILCELAPLLTQEARKALVKRQAEVTARAQRTPARNRAQEPFENIPAMAALPQGRLPWSVSPEKRKLPERGKKAGTSAPERPSFLKTDLPESGRESGRPEAFAAATRSGCAGKTGIPALSAEESRILSLLSGKTLHIDDLSRALDLDVSRLSGLLTMLEMRGLVVRSPGTLYGLPGDLP